MKIRLGFVSNSSTSSFFCPICDESYMGMDDMSYEDMGFTRCENGHVWCSDCYKKYKDECPFCSLEIIEDFNVINYLLAITSKTREEIMDEMREKFKGYGELVKFLKQSKDFFPKRRDIYEDQKWICQ